jgi:GTPase SAR1 family protein
MFDMTDLITLKNVPYWMEELKQHSDNPSIILVGTKYDLFEK